ncbi:MAG TPA: hypothetical protein VNY30_07365 [Bryobacteraceae bacterium]|nr:hypothetical protein [Bryobacteraceae bacterium]
MKRLLSREVLKENLCKAALYLIGYEMLTESIIRRPEGFFTMGGAEAQTRYKTKVLSLDRDKLIASCKWFEKSGVLTAEEIEEIRAIRKHRTDIAHEMPNVILNADQQVDELKLASMYRLISKIDRWWLMEIEIPCDEAFDGQEIDPSDVKSGKMEFFKLLIASVYGHDSAE